MVDNGHQEAVVGTIGCGLEEPATTAAMLKQTEIEEVVDEGTIDGPFSLAAKGEASPCFHGDAPRRRYGGTSSITDTAIDYNDCEPRACARAGDVEQGHCPDGGGEG